MKQQKARVKKETCNLQLTQLMMHRLTQVAKAMRLICPPQWLFCVMSRHQVALTEVHIIQTKS
jgi:hypothetical protein